MPRIAKILKKWDVAASLSVDELELGCGDFKAVEQTSVADDLFDDNSMSTPPQRGQQIQQWETGYAVVLMWCLAGIHVPVLTRMLGV